MKEIDMNNMLTQLRVNAALAKTNVPNETAINTSSEKPNKLIIRAYSVASSSVAREYLEFYISLVRSGSLTPRLFNLEKGDKLWLSTHFSGMFTLHEIPIEFSVALIATGTGVAP